MSDKNIIPHDHKIKKEDRERLKKHKPIVLWFTGLSGSGKSTLTSALEQKLYEEEMHTYILDGDNVRSGLNKGLTFSDEDRKENIRRISEVAKLFADAGLITLTAFISPFKEDRALAKSLVGEDEFMEIFVDCPLEICEQRDVKGLYQKAREGKIKKFTGIDSPFEAPENADVVIHTDRQSLEASVEQLYKAVINRIK
ncbi:MAG: adenylyl-sulfate kinase [Flammeovirgaceae bacterium]|nr:adenylyl-sulfate kinase [Flammeovirgaceae bacterium]